MNVIEVTTIGQTSPVALVNGQLIHFASQTDYFEFKAQLEKQDVHIIRWRCTPAQRKLIDPGFTVAE